MWARRVLTLFLDEEMLWGVCDRWQTWHVGVPRRVGVMDTWLRSRSCLKPFTRLSRLLERGPCLPSSPPSSSPQQGPGPLCSVGTAHMWDRPRTSSRHPQALSVPHPFFRCFRSTRYPPSPHHPPAAANRRRDNGGRSKTTSEPRSEGRAEVSRKARMGPRGAGQGSTSRRRAPLPAPWKLRPRSPHRPGQTPAREEDLCLQMDERPF